MDYRLSEEVRNSINQTVMRELGISYDEFELLDFDEQQRLIEQNRCKKKNSDEFVTVMIGSGEDAIFVQKRRGEKYMLTDGTIVVAGATPESERKRINDKIDMIISKDEGFVKKLTRKFKRK